MQITKKVKLAQPNETIRHKNISTFLSNNLNNHPLHKFMISNEGLIGLMVIF